MSPNIDKTCFQYNLRSKRFTGELLQMFTNKSEIKLLYKGCEFPHVKAFIK